MRIRAGAAAILLTASLTGCTQAVAVDPAQDAENVTCASIVIALPDTVNGQQQRETTSQGTGAWGDPASVVLRCGVAPPEPTSTLPCVGIGSIDWLEDDATAPVYVYTSYGREPAVSVSIEASDDIYPGEVLYDLESAVALTREVSACTSVEDSS
jgi:hypothetical protein